MTVNAAKSIGRMQALLSKEDAEDVDDIEADPLEVHVVDDTERALLERRLALETYTIDRGTGYYAEERLKRKRPALVQSGQ